MAKDKFTRNIGVRKNADIINKVSEENDVKDTKENILSNIIK